MHIITVLTIDLTITLLYTVNTCIYKVNMIICLRTCKGSHECAGELGAPGPALGIPKLVEGASNHAPPLQQQLAYSLGYY